MWPSLVERTPKKCVAILKRVGRRFSFSCCLECYVNFSVEHPTTTSDSAPWQASPRHPLGPIILNTQQNLESNLPKCCLSTSRHSLAWGSVACLGWPRSRVRYGRLGSPSTNRSVVQDILWLTTAPKITLQCSHHFSIINHTFYKRCLHFLWIHTEIYKSLLN